MDWNQVKLLRQSARMDIAQLAKKSGVPENVISDLERGTPPANKLLAEAVLVRLADVLTSGTPKVKI